MYSSGREKQMLFNKQEKKKKKTEKENKKKKIVEKEGQNKIKDFVHKFTIKPFDNNFMLQIRKQKDKEI